MAFPLRYETVKILTDTVKESQSQKLKDVCIKSLGKIRKEATEPLVTQINSLIKEAIAPDIRRQEKEKAVAEEIKKAEVEAFQNAAKQEIKVEVSPNPVTTSSIEDADLLAELASFSEPGDIPPSRVAAGGKSLNKAEAKDPASAEDNAAIARAEKLEKEQEAAKKVITRMNTTLAQLSPRLRLEAEKQIRMGKIKNDAQFKIWLKRVKR